VRKYQKISECPAKAKDIIDFANLSVAVRHIELAKYCNDFGDSEKQKKLFYELVRELPHEAVKQIGWLQRILNNETVSPESALAQKKGKFYEEASLMPPSEFRAAFLQYIEEDGEVYYIAPLAYLIDKISASISCRRVLTNLTQDNGFARHSIDNNRVLTGEIIRNCQLTIDENGILEIGANYPLNVINSEKIDTRRFRLCPVCDTYFWAKRLDAKTCGEKQCVEKISGKKSYKKNKDKITRKKREAYYKSKEIDFCPECVRPIENHGESDCKLNNSEVKNNGTL
jgi:hypothetical protein